MQNATTTPTQSPVDDATYDLLQALTSKLEAIEAYQLYAEDEEVRDVFERLGRDEVEHAEVLLQALRERLANTRSERAVGQRRVRSPGAPLRLSTAASTMSRALNAASTSPTTEPSDGATGGDSASGVRAARMPPGRLPPAARRAGAGGGRAPRRCPGRPQVEQPRSIAGSVASRVAGSAPSSAASSSSIFCASFVVVNQASVDGTSRATRARAFGDGVLRAGEGEVGRVDRDRRPRARAAR